MSNIRYADDTVLLADSTEDLEDLVDGVNMEGWKHVVNINAKNTKFRMISKEKHPKALLIINDEQVERVREFKYLGMYITERLKPMIEVKKHIVDAKTAFINKMKFFFFIISSG